MIANANAIVPAMPSRMSVNDVRAIERRMEDQWPLLRDERRDCEGNDQSNAERHHHAARRHLGSSSGANCAPALAQQKGGGLAATYFRVRKRHTTAEGSVAKRGLRKDDRASGRWRRSAPGSDRPGS